jgi:hypothetical protein
MATDCPVLPAPLGYLLIALTSAKDAVDGAELRYLLAASTVAVLERDLSTVNVDEYIERATAAEREQVAFNQARAILLVVVDRVLEAAAPYLPANDAHDQAAE